MIIELWVAIVGGVATIFSSFVAGIFLVLARSRNRDSISIDTESGDTKSYLESEVKIMAVRVEQQAYTVGGINFTLKDILLLGSSYLNGLKTESVGTDVLAGILYAVSRKNPDLRSIALEYIDNNRIRNSWHTDKGVQDKCLMNINDWKNAHRSDQMIMSIISDCISYNILISETIGGYGGHNEYKITDSGLALIKYWALLGYMD